MPGGRGRRGSGQGTQGRKERQRLGLRLGAVKMASRVSRQESSTRHCTTSQHEQRRGGQVRWGCGALAERLYC